MPPLTSTDDPRCEVGAFITNGKELREVTDRMPSAIRAEDCKDGTPWTMDYKIVRDHWELVRGPAAEFRCPEFFSEAA